MLRHHLLAIFITTTLTSHAAQAGAGEATPVTLDVCTMDRDFAPFTTTQFTGQWQNIVRNAAKEAGVQIRFFAAPRERCLSEVITGQTDAIFSATLGGRERQMQFPHTAKGTIDESTKVGQPTYRVYRRKGSSVDWDGKKFSNLGTGNIGVQVGIYPVEVLRQLGVAVETTASPTQTLMKLNLGRVTAAVVNEEHTAIAMREIHLDQVEALPIPLATERIYLPVSFKFYKAHPAEVERLWKAIQKFAPK